MSIEIVKRRGEEVQTESKEVKSDEQKLEIETISQLSHNMLNKNSESRARKL